MLEEIKVCRTCGLELPLTTEYFSTSKVNKDGFRNDCKKCRVKYSQQYYEKHKKDVTEYKKQYEKKNKERLRKHRKQFWEVNKDRLNEKKRQYWKEHKEEKAMMDKLYRETHKDTATKYAKQYQIKNKDKIARKRKEYYEKNKEAIQRKNKKYAEKHEDLFKTIKERYRNRKRQLPATLTAEQWIQTKQHFNDRCCYCGKEKPLQQEHFIPLSKGGELSKGNILPACQSCNCSKHNKDFREWYPKYKYYSKKREKDILEFLGYKNNEQQLSLI